MFFATLFVLNIDFEEGERLEIDSAAGKQLEMVWTCFKERRERLAENAWITKRKISGERFEKDNWIRYLNTEDAVDHSEWRLIIKDIG